MLAHGRDKRTLTAVSVIMMTNGSKMRSLLTKGSADNECCGQKRPRPQRGDWLMAGDPEDVDSQGD